MNFLLFTIKWIFFSAGITGAVLISAYWCIRLFLYWDGLEGERKEKWNGI